MEAVAILPLSQHRTDASLRSSLSSMQLEFNSPVAAPHLDDCAAPDSGIANGVKTPSTTTKRCVVHSPTDSHPTFSPAVEKKLSFPPSHHSESEGKSPGKARGSGHDHPSTPIQVCDSPGRLPVGHDSNMLNTTQKKSAEEMDQFMSQALISGWSPTAGLSGSSMGGSLEQCEAKGWEEDLKHQCKRKAVKQQTGAERHGCARLIGDRRNMHFVVIRVDEGHGEKLVELSNEYKVRENVTTDSNKECSQYLQLLHLGVWMR